MKNIEKTIKKAENLIPGGVSLFSKKPQNFLQKGWPSYFIKTDKVYVWDLNKKKYLDMFFGVGTNTLGYNNKEVDKAVIECCRNGNMSSLNSIDEVMLAEKLVSLNPWASKVRFARTGGEANAIAIRIARAASGKDKVAVCGYHGWHDWYLSANLSNKKNLDKLLLEGLKPKGVPKSLINSVYTFEYNDLAKFKKIVATNNIGVVKMEVRRDEKPKNNFLQSIRKICDKKNIVLIFDECTTGFRENYGGLYKKYAVVPDIVLFGKALGNGYAITAIVGKDEVMKYGNETFISSTFWTERIGFVAANKTLEVMKKQRSWIKIKKNGKLIKDTWKRLAREHNLNIKIGGIDPLPSISFKSKNNLGYKTLITQEMLKEKILCSNLVFASMLHTKKIIDIYEDHLSKVFKKISNCENGYSLKKYLKNGVCNSGFKRLT